jgi:hypothetical protein
MNPIMSVEQMGLALVLLIFCITVLLILAFKIKGTTNPKNRKWVKRKNRDKNHGN